VNYGKVQVIGDFKVSFTKAPRHEPP